MLDYIRGLISDFEREHGMRPNLLYMNQFHSDHLQSAFSENHSLGHLMELLQLDLIIDSGSVHPHVCWTHLAQRAAS